LEFDISDGVWRFPILIVAPVWGTDLSKFAEGDEVKIEGKFLRLVLGEGYARHKIYIAEARLMKVG
jgi:hypothetical protein